MKTDTPTTHPPEVAFLTPNGGLVQGVTRVRRRGG